MRILIIEDNKGDYILLRELLGEYNADFDHLWAQSLKEGLEVIQKKKIDVVLLDMGLPDSLGLKTVESVRSAGNNFAIVVVTGNANEQTGIESMKHGADDYLVKGDFSSRLLHKSIRYSIERRRYAKETKEREELLERFLNAATDGFAVFDNQLNVLRANPAALSSWNLTIDEATGKNLTEISPDLKASERYKKYMEVIETGKPFEIDEFRPHPVFGDIYISVKAFKVGNGLGISVNDITERKKAEQLQRKANDIIRRSKAVVFRWKNQPDFPLEFVSENIDNLCGYRAEEFYRNDVTWPGITHPDDDKRLRNELKEHAKSGDREFTLEYRIIAKSGELIWIHDHTRAIYGGPGKITHYDSVLINISKQKEIEEELNQKNLQLEEANKTKDKFFSILSHDLRTPFNSIIGYLDLLNEDFDGFSDHQKKKFIRNLLDTSTKTLSLLDNLLEWSRSQRGHIRHKPEKFRLIEVIRDAAGLIRNNAEKKHIKMMIDIDDHEMVFADRQMIYTVIRNLLSNAVKFSFPGSMIEISGDSLNGYTIFSVSDSGTGMDEDTLEKLFKIDEDINKTGTAKEKGTGLGLMLCRDFVEKNNGKIDVKSLPGKGTTFMVFLPADQPVMKKAK